MEKFICSAEKYGHEYCTERLGNYFRVSDKFKSKDVLKTLPMYNSRPAFVVFLFCDPHLLESGERTQYRSTYPHRVLPLGRSGDFHLHGARAHGCYLLGQSVFNARKHSGTSRQNNVGVHISADIDITSHDGVMDLLVYATGL